eukprot:CAMPEP_0169424290 /NCGR_PEP_ID=MMETSP1017-20121227/67955_1 /TAXON_ID=342587 /ORGANISM="Karlodinium micrum, Strain CCMP2283" /LENGTH=258 /DNA_ID=CAMNT_0009534051 /DNA_START=114 /DNA_END=890 /DNA_ORIENTATION=-
MGTSEVLGLEEFAMEPAVLPSDSAGVTFDSDGDDEDESFDLDDDDEEEDDVVDLRPPPRFAKEIGVVQPVGRPSRETFRITLELLEWERVSHMISAEAIDFGGFRNLAPYATYASKGGILDGMDFTIISISLRQAAEVMAAIRKFDGNGVELLPSYFDGLSSHALLRRSIDNAIDKDGSILDAADTELRKCRMRRRQIDAEISEKMSSIAKANARWIQGGGATFCNGVMVIGIAKKWKHYIPGNVLVPFTSNPKRRNH